MFLQVSRRWFRENNGDHFGIYAAAVWGAADADTSGKLLTPCPWVLASCTSYEDARPSAMHWRCELSLSSRLTWGYVFISQMKCEHESMQIILASVQFFTIFFCGSKLSDKLLNVTVLKVLFKSIWERQR